MKKNQLTLVIAFMLVVVVLSACSANSAKTQQTDGQNSVTKSEPLPKPEPVDEWFSNISWNGSEVDFTAKQDVTIAGISVFVDDKEYKGDVISNVSGNMGLPSGATAWAGSKLSLNRNHVIVYKDTVANCAVDTGGKMPGKVVFYLAGGEEFEKTL